MEGADVARIQSLPECVHYPDLWLVGWWVGEAWMTAWTERERETGREGRERERESVCVCGATWHNTNNKIFGSEWAIEELIFD